MTKKDIVKAVIGGKATGSVPYFIEPTKAGKKKLAEYYGTDVDSLEEFMGNCLLYLNYTHPLGFTPEVVGKGLIKDEFGSTWDTEAPNEVGDWSIVDHPVKDMDLTGYVFPSSRGEGRFDAADAVLERNPGKFNLLQMLGVFEIPCRITGMEDILVAMAVDEAFACKMLDMALEFNLGILEKLPPYMDGVRFIEDWGDQRGLIMGAGYWRKYLKSRLKLMYDACRKTGRSVFIHSCGNITELIPDLIEIGVEVIDPIQPEVMDLRYIKKEYGRDVTFFGGVGSQSTIPLGAPADVIREAEGVLGFMAEGGRFILGPSGAIPTDAPVENIAALIDFCKNMDEKTREE